MSLVSGVKFTGVYYLYWFKSVMTSSGLEPNLRCIVGPRSESPTAGSYPLCLTSKFYFWVTYFPRVVVTKWRKNNSDRLPSREEAVFLWKVGVKIFQSYLDTCNHPSPQCSCGIEHKSIYIFQTHYITSPSFGVSRTKQIYTPPTVIVITQTKMLRTCSLLAYLAVAALIPHRGLQKSLPN